MIPKTPYEEMGGEPAVRRLVERFYDIMDRDPALAGIRRLHPADLAQSRSKLFLFLSGWLGGPNLYAERFGHPRLRARHLPFPIGLAERDQWMACMVQAMEEVGIEKGLRLRLSAAFFRTADFMRNREG